MQIKINKKAFLLGVLSAVGILAIYLLFLTLFQSSGFAIYEFRKLWVWLVPLSIGFGTQIGLYLSIRHNSKIKAGVSTSGTISGGSMLICCSHYIIGLIPLVGLAGFSQFLMSYQKAFFALGILSSVTGIILILNHKRKMHGGNC